MFILGQFLDCTNLLLQLRKICQAYQNPQLCLIFNLYKAAANQFVSGGFKLSKLRKIAKKLISLPCHPRTQKCQKYIFGALKLKVIGCLVKYSLCTYLSTTLNLKTKRITVFLQKKLYEHQPCTRSTKITLGEVDFKEFYDLEIPLKKWETLNLLTDGNSSTYTKTERNGQKGPLFFLLFFTPFPVMSKDFLHKTVLTKKVHKKFHNKCPYKSVHKKGPQKGSTKNIHQKCPQKHPHKCQKNVKKIGDKNGKYIELPSQKYIF